MPLISIITVTYNAERFIEKTLKSIEKQTEDDFELIIIDGGSKDGTIKIIQKYKYIIQAFVSEPDRGIYDAMNKGMLLANGRFLWFINAGDEIAEPETISKLKARIKASTELVYADAFFFSYESGIRGKRSELTPHRLHEHLNWQDLKYGMLVCHQALLVKRELAPEYILNNLSADLEWEIESFKRSSEHLFLDFPIAKYLEGGISNQQLRRSLCDRFLVLQKHFGLFPNILNHFHILFRGLGLIAKNKRKYW